MAPFLQEGLQGGLRYSWMATWTRRSLGGGPGATYLNGALELDEGMLLRRASREEAPGRRDAGAEVVVAHFYLRRAAWRGG